MVDRTFTFPSSNFIGFDHLWAELDSLSRANENNFPRHNIVKHSDTEYSIELALAGFHREELDVEVKEGHLIISGEPSKIDNRDYVHKGITGRRFKRTFRLAEHVQVCGADFMEGILRIDLEVVIPENKRPLKIRIGDGQDESQLLTED